ncbi:hypothetical protein Bbelb_319070 [Branchiostoma belcheri]|nr:hypothetical protein Bbelb_319070 [Branchiostoma belcheri]
MDQTPPAERLPTDPTLFSSAHAGISGRRPRVRTPVYDPEDLRRLGYDPRTPSNSPPPPRRRRSPSCNRCSTAGMEAQHGHLICQHLTGEALEEVKALHSEERDDIKLVLDTLKRAFRETLPAHIVMGRFYTLRQGEDESGRLVEDLNQAKPHRPSLKLTVLSLSQCGRKVDGFCEETNTVYEYSGCLYNGCQKCFKPHEGEPCKRHRDDRTLREQLAKEELRVSRVLGDQT